MSHPGIDDSKARELGHQIDLAEPYRDTETGKLCVAMPCMNGQIRFGSIEDWTKNSKDLGEYLSKRFDKSKIFWKLPQTPDLDDDDTNLLSDFIRAIDPFVDFADDRLPEVFAIWVAATWVSDLLPKCVHLMTHGPTNSGKGRLLSLVDYLAYRGSLQSNPTPAVLTRLAAYYDMTLAIEETQDLDRESIQYIWNVVKNAFDGVPTYRCNSDNSDIDRFNLRVPIAFSVKTKMPPEDVQNRSLHFPMRQSERTLAYDPEESEEFRMLRTRFFTFRLRMLNDLPAFDKHLERAGELASQPFLVNGEPCQLNGRARDIARSLLTVALIFNKTDDIMAVIQDSQAKAKDELRETLECKIFIAFQSVYADNSHRVPVLEVREKLITNLTEQGDVDQHRDIKTRTVTSTLKALGFRIMRGTNNAPFIDMRNVENQNTYRDRVRTFGLDGGDKL